MSFIAALKNMFGISKSGLSNSGGRVIESQNGHSANYEIPEIVVLHEGDTIQLKSEGGYILLPMTVIKKIDTGGFGTVFIVEMSGKEYALKVLTLWLKLPKEWPDLIRRFESSFRAGKVFSEYIIDYHEKGYYKGNPCILMEYCPNKNLEERLEDFYPEEKWKVLGVELLSGLKALHSSGIIHKDFKPKNIIFGKDDKPKLTDFDFSAFLDKRNTMTRGGRALDLWYTAIYSPPEQIDPKTAYEKTSPPLDMFSFAVTMYQVISGGKLPWGSFEEYNGDNDAYYEKIKSGDFIPIQQHRPEMPAIWANCINRCLQPNIEDRVQTPALFLNMVSGTVSPPKPDIQDKPLENEEKNEPKPSKMTSHIIEVRTGTNNVGQQYVLQNIKNSYDKEEIVLGRGRSADLFIDAILPNEGVHHISRKHATLKCSDEHWMICDGCLSEDGHWEGSTNGTEVFNPETGNNDNISNTGFYKLNEGDILNLAGEVTLKYYKVNI